MAAPGHSIHSADVAAVTESEEGEPLLRHSHARPWSSPQDGAATTRRAMPPAATAYPPLGRCARSPGSGPVCVV